MSKHLGSTATAAPEQQEEAWLTKCKSETLKSSEWRELVASVFKETKTELSKRHIVFFSELTHEEKADCMEDVQSSLKGSREFQKMIVMLRHSVDVGLSEAITAEIAAGKHPASATKIDVLMKKASTAATGLLADWPRNHQHLSLMLNRGLTGTLRRPSWELFLSRKDARAHYEEKISKQPSSTISSKDLEILQKCQRLLVSDFAAVAGSSRLAVTVMKTVISYCHVLSRNDEFLSDSSELLHLLVPLLAVFQDCCAAGDAKSLIEHYLALLVMVRPDVFSGYSSLVTVPPASASIPARTSHVIAHKPSRSLVSETLSCMLTSQPLESTATLPRWCSPPCTRSTATCTSVVSPSTWCTSSGINACYPTLVSSQPSQRRSSHSPERSCSKHTRLCTVQCC
eukprot:TRINITY_DN12770_c0_g1_i2.p1 TRINITY_DN12770_c0_g1~~TRINITY_DN12770_c0_g1_i2.p1  ORF type:complete len:399 (-),score=68.12 TRINITY_DN12770_c0_g1_i2:300-1496(-)